ncbi:glycosyltransferase [Ectobacillus ponti]|uniref:Glycosyltransferase family 2 protein n=1 Tax=Ectobacillus ponti TaxID=2961894 RepID=A0AA42BMX6_9BACI|nr:glycosyltransferase family 2 protein [Ectobacillus ponti]MCP8967345.1 glycosyltransferase family 2 protein [Ectobacillus ponti]
MLAVLLVVILLFWLLVGAQLVPGLYRLENLEHVQTTSAEPFVSVIIAARNEEAAIESALRSQVAQRYQHVEWIVVNDRSTDRTGDLLERFSASNPRIQPIHVKQLPNGWLGKNHALYTGYQHAKGDLLLFMDADVLMEPDCLQKAVSYLSSEQADHITVLPNLTASGIWLTSFIGHFLFSFTYLIRPWKANDDHSKVGLGIGAFNLIAKTAYEKMGTHKAIRMRPDDDLQLGMKVKEAGLRQRVVSGSAMLRVHWYSTLREAFIGLEKNTFAAYNYRLWLVAFSITALFLFHVLPYLALLFSSGLQQLFSLGSVLAISLLYGITLKKTTAYSLFHVPLFPFAAALLICSIVRTMILVFKRGGIVWRGTLYSLRELREQQNK